VLSVFAVSCFFSVRRQSYLTAIFYLGRLQRFEPAFFRFAGPTTACAEFRRIGALRSDPS
jgi:hypothetical protein